MVGASPPAVGMARCEYGMPIPGVLCSSIGGSFLLCCIILGCMQWRGHRMANASLRQVRMYRCGMLLMEVMSTPTRGIPVVCMQWHGHRMANTSLREALIRQYKYGKHLF